MSAGRNLRPEATSYRETGIPCGNPSRYKSRGVIRMNMKDSTPFSDQRTDQPGEGTESEAEQQLKRMVQSQLDTKLSLESQKARQKAFTSSAKYKGFDPESTGTLSLKDYKSLEERNKYIEELELYGLTQDEIQFKLEHEGLIPKAAKRSRFGANPITETERLAQLQKKIEEKESSLSKPDSFSNVQLLSRHAMEVEMSLNKGTDKADSFKHLVQLDKPGASTEDSLLQSILGDKCFFKPQHKKRSLCKQTEESTTSSIQTAPTGNILASNEKLDTRFEVSDQDGRLSLTTFVASLPEEEIIKNRLSVESIREIPRFHDYKPGNPTKVLYVKNLNPKATEEDLVTLFSRFQSKNGPKVIFRLMKGRMKGQAFVTFKDAETATNALNLVNGYQLKGKPLVIEYGRQSATESKSPD